jgi:HSP20 family molecular chaperone IbpA
MVLYSDKEILSNEIADPVTTLLDEGKYFRVITEFPDVSEETIHIDLENTILMISATESESGKKYKKIIALPLDVRLDKKKFQNGILDLTWKKNPVHQSNCKFFHYLLILFQNMYQNL